MTLFRCLVAASALVLFGGCSTQAAPPAQVATLSTPGSPTGSGPTTSAADPDNGRPRERIDMTNSDIEALYTTYSACMAEHGFDKAKAATMPNHDQASAKAAMACLSKKPLPPWELDASNPHATDFLHAVVQCLRSKGVQYVEEHPPTDGWLGPSFGGPQNDATSISKGLELTPTCEKDVAAQGIGK